MSQETQNPKTIEVVDLKAQTPLIELDDMKTGISVTMSCDANAILTFVPWSHGHSIQGRLMREPTKEGPLMSLRLDSTEDARFEDPLLWINPSDFESVKNILHSCMGHEVTITQQTDGCSLRVDSGPTVMLKALGLSIQFKLAPGPDEPEFDAVGHRILLEERMSLIKAWRRVFKTDPQIGRQGQY